MRNKRWFLGLALAVLSAPCGAEVYQIDLAHSGVLFRVSHMMVSRVTGQFGKFGGSVTYDKANPKSWKVDVAIDAASINTNNEMRDKHLRTADFFDVEKHPQITFKSTQVKDVKGNKAKLLGDLTLHGVTKPVVLDIEIGGTVKSKSGNDHLGATATTKIDRKDFGIIWNKSMDSGGMMVGEQVDVTIEIEAIAKK